MEIEDAQVHVFLEDQKLRWNYIIKGEKDENSEQLKAMESFSRTSSREKRFVKKFIESTAFDPPELVNRSINVGLYMELIARFG